MVVRESHMLAGFMIVVALATGYVNHQQAREADRKANAALVDGCVRNSARVAVSAAGWDDIARFREKRGESPKSIMEVSEATKRYVALPKGVKRNDPRPFEVIHIRYPDGRGEIRPTAQALNLIEAGCRQAYPAP